MKKYKQGEQIKSLDVLAEQEFIYVVYGKDCYKVYHKGWFSSWQFRNVDNLIGCGRVFKAEKIKENKTKITEEMKINEV